MREITQLGAFLDDVAAHYSYSLPQLKDVLNSDFNTQISIVLS